LTSNVQIMLIAHKRSRAKRAVFQKKILNLRKDCISDALLQKHWRKELHGGRTK